MTQTVALLTSAEVAEELDLDISTVNRDAARGRLKSEKKHPGLRGPRVFTRAAVDEYRREREGDPAS